MALLLLRRYGIIGLVSRCRAAPHAAQKSRARKRTWPKARMAASRSAPQILPLDLVADLVAELHVVLVLALHVLLVEVRVFRRKGLANVLLHRLPRRLNRAIRACGRGLVGLVEVPDHLCCVEKYVV